VARGKGTRQAVAACGSREEFKQKRTENKAATKVRLYNENFSRFLLLFLDKWTVRLDSSWKKKITLHSYAPSPHLPRIFTHTCVYFMQFHCTFATRFNRLSAAKRSANTAETPLHRRHKSQHCALPGEHNTTEREWRRTLPANKWFMKMKTTTEVLLVVVATK